MTVSEPGNFAGECFTEVVFSCNLAIEYNTNIAAIDNDIQVRHLVFGNVIDWDICEVGPSTFAAFSDDPVVALSSTAGVFEVLFIDVVKDVKDIRALAAADCFKVKVDRVRLADFQRFIDIDNKAAAIAKQSRAAIHFRHRRNIFVRIVRSAFAVNDLICTIGDGHVVEEAVGVSVGDTEYIALELLIEFVNDLQFAVFKQTNFPAPQDFDFDTGRSIFVDAVHW